jgi:hypothetical protein
MVRHIIQMVAPLWPLFMMINGIVAQIYNISKADFLIVMTYMRSTWMGGEFDYGVVLQTRGSTKSGKECIAT